LDKNIIIEFTLKIRIDWCNKISKRVEFECLSAGTFILQLVQRSCIRRHEILCTVTSSAQVSNLGAIIYIKVLSKNTKQNEQGATNLERLAVGLRGPDGRNGVTSSSHVAISLFEYNLGLLERFFEPF
jgi:hypothetical protein